MAGNKDSAHTEQQHPSPRDPTDQAIDSRRAERLALQLPISYTINIQGRELRGSGHTTNVSGGGLQLVVPQACEQKAPCQVLLTLPDAPKPLAFRGHIAWANKLPTAQASEQYEIGIAFETPESYEEQTFACFSQFIANQLLHKYLK